MEICNVGSRRTNLYLYPVEEGWAMIDTGYEGSFRAVVDRMRKRDIALSDIRVLFLTHAHDEHAGFLRQLLEVCPRLICVANEDAWPILARGENPPAGGCISGFALFLERLHRLFGKRDNRFPPLYDSFRQRFIFVGPGRTARGEAVLGGRILFTPGHTADSISLEVGNVVFCGDAVMNGLPGRHCMTSWISDLEEYANSWEVLLEADADMLYPARGKPFHKGVLNQFREELSHVQLRRLE